MRTRETTGYVSQKLKRMKYFLHSNGMCYSLCQKAMNTCCDGLKRAVHPNANANLLLQPVGADVSSNKYDT